MSLPHVTWICLTHARNENLRSVADAFLRQDYGGIVDMIILNTMPEQELQLSLPADKVLPLRGIKIINLGNMPSLPKPSIGEARNLAISEVPEHSICLTTDDDDHYATWHTSNFVSQWNESCEWAWLSAEFYSECGQIKSITKGTPNTFAFTKKAWREVGGFAAMNCGEDRNFIGKVTGKFPGITVELPKHRISFVRGFADGNFHVSGMGDREQETRLVHVDAWVKEKVQRGQIRTGKIIIEPKALFDVDAAIKQFTTAVSQIDEAKAGKVGIVELGRFGDILNILPVAKFIADRYDKPHFFVSKEFASVLDGVSYVIPEVLALPHDQITAAVTVASNKCSLVINSQVWGVNYVTSREHPVYNVESWRMAGFLNEFSNLKDFPLVIDRRDEGRERKLAERLPMAGKPTVLVNIGSGHTAPYLGAPTFFHSLCAAWSSQFNILDISQVRAERIYDLLGLFDRAVLLVSNDTATIHLAAAHTIPVVFIANDNPWLSSVTRCNVVLRSVYSDALRRMNEVNAVLRQLQLNAK